MSTARIVGVLLGVLTFAACGSSDPASGASEVCKDEGKSCTCPGSAKKSTYACEDDELVCACEDSVEAAPKDAGTTKKDAGKDEPEPPATKPDAGKAPTTPSTGGTGGSDASTPVTPATPNTPFTGPVDGDPSKPMVSVPGVPCGAGKGGFGAAPPTVKIGGRDVVLFYPCAHEGAAVTFLFTLHGTLQEAQKVAFTLNAGPFHTLADSHNIIYVLPKAVGTQWGREDNGTDLPHIHEVIDWVYTTFGEKFDIRSMWAQGGSWGAFYLSSTLACDKKLESRLKGVRLIVGGGCPACSSRLSCIVAQQELEKGMGMALSPEGREMLADQSAIPTYAKQHGCEAKMGPKDVGNTKYWSWPNCQKGWVHSYYLAPGQHADPWDPVAIKQTADEMKSIE